MDLKVKRGEPLKQKTPCLVLSALEGKLRTPLLKELDQILDGALTRAVRDKEF
jgi:leucyl aminopeptidase